MEKEDLGRFGVDVEELALADGYGLDWCSHLSNKQGLIKSLYSIRF